MKMKPRRCKWHECNRTFLPRHHLQYHCSAQCQKDRANWKMKRGAPLVEALLAGDAEAMARQREEIISEVWRATKCS